MSKSYIMPFHYDPILQGIYEAAVYAIPRVLNNHAKTVDDLAAELNSCMITPHDDERITSPIITAISYLNQEGLIKPVFSQMHLNYIARSDEEGYEEKLNTFLSDFYRNVQSEREKRMLP